MLTLVLVTLVGVPVYLPGEAEALRFQEASHRALVHFSEGDLGAAVANFRLAERLRATSEVAYDLAKCHERLGDVAFASYYYRLYMRRAPEAPDTLDVAGRVGQALAAAEARGEGYLELQATQATSIEVAGRRFPDGPVALFLPAGSYEVAADFGAGPRRMSVQVRAGQATSQPFEPWPAPLVPTERALSEALLAQGLDRPPDGTPARVGGLVLAGTGLAAVAAGVILGLVAAKDASAMRASSPTPASEAQALGERARAEATGAGVLLGAGGAAVGGGVLMFVLSLGDGDGK